MVLDLEKIKTTLSNEINSLKRRVKKLEKRNISRTHKLKRIYKVGLTARVDSFGDEDSLGEDASKQGKSIDAIDADDEITLVNDVDKGMFDVDDLGGDEAFVAEQEVVKDVNENVVDKIVKAAQDSTTTTTITTEEITLAQALKALKTSKPKVKWTVIQEQEEPCKSTTTTIAKQQSQDKGKGIMIKEHVKPKKKDQIRLDEEASKRLQAEFDKKERISRKKAQKEKEVNIALIETWDDIQAKIDADHQLAERLQAQEQEEFSDAEKAKLFQQLLEKRKKALYLEDLYKLLKAKFKSTRPVEDLDLLLWDDLKTMFEPRVEDKVWKLQQGYKVLNWKLYDFCGVHSLIMQSMQVYMLVEKTYPLTPPTLSMMLEKKLQIDYPSEMAYQLLKLIKKQLKK
uniref:Uncharacterized protein n=1 Tax=Tanacetum cinerariifolium TaxID=118510 RepID=A0A6L2J9F5_TANCI|nr:hypothetical protein [Tanacetum cinerariifolium]